MSHSLHQSVAARLYVKFWEKMELIDYNIFQYKHPIIWGTFFLFTVTLPLAPFAVGVAGLVLGFGFSRYLDRKGIFMDKKLERLKEEEAKIELRLKKMEADKKELELKDKERVLNYDSEIDKIKIEDLRNDMKHRAQTRDELF